MNLYVGNRQWTVCDMQFTYWAVKKGSALDWKVVSSYSWTTRKISMQTFNGSPLWFDGGHFF